MKFGAIENPDQLDLGLPPTNVIIDDKSGLTFQAWVGAGKWEKKYLHNFFPPGTKDELGYYASQFNSLEFNATHYKRFTGEQYEKWASMVPEDFKFFPKMNKWVSHTKWLNGIEDSTTEFVDQVAHLGEKLGARNLHAIGVNQIKFLSPYLKLITQYTTASTLKSSYSVISRGFMSSWCGTR